MIMLATRGHLDLSSWLQPARLWRHRAVSQAAVAAVAAAALTETARGGRVVGISAGSSAFCCQAWSATLVPTVCGHPSVPWPISLHLGHCTSCSCHVQLLTLRPDVREGETDLPPHSARHVFGERVKQLFFFFFFRVAVYSSFSKNSMHHVLKGPAPKWSEPQSPTSPASWAPCRPSLCSGAAPGALSLALPEPPFPPS